MHNLVAIYPQKDGAEIQHCVFLLDNDPGVRRPDRVFLMPGRVRKHNVAVAGESAYKLKALRS